MSIVAELNSICVGLVIAGLASTQTGRVKRTSQLPKFMSKRCLVLGGGWRFNCILQCN